MHHHHHHHRPHRSFFQMAFPAGVLGAAIAAAVLLAPLSVWRSASAGEDEPEPPPTAVPLKAVPVPGPPLAVLDEYVQDRTALLQLGKALYWDSRVGSDNRTACASCHFHAGADNRIRNQVGPGLLAGDRTFQLGGPNYLLQADDFPLTHYRDINDVASRDSDRNDIVSSQGVFTARYTGVSRTGSPDACDMVSDALDHGGSGFNLNGVNTRRVEPRNTPTVINAIFNFRNFWDGRANQLFNGVDPFGLRNPTAIVWRVEDGLLRRTSLQMPLSSLSSLGAGPPLSENEMSCRARAFVDLARKLLPLVPLSEQVIAPNDSVLGPMLGRRQTYAGLIGRAFRSAYWSAPGPLTLQAQEWIGSGSMDLESSRRASILLRRGHPIQTVQMEANFPMFFGMAMQAYLSTLVSDDTPYDRFADGKQNALSDVQKRGFELFRGRAGCMHCHVGAELTSASTSNVLSDGRLDHRDGAGGTVFHYDNGFFNTGVRPTADDQGVGGLDPFGFPMSETRITQLGRADLLGKDFHEELVAPDALTAVEGAFKTPGLRNVELTGPYFHNGGVATLMQVVDFYNRGGDFGAANAPLTDPAVHPLGLSEEQKQSLVAFLLALSDERVAYEKAPFDHPSLCLPHGHRGNASRVDADRKGNAIDRMQCLAAVGANGRRERLTPFLRLDPYRH